MVGNHLLLPYLQPDPDLSRAGQVPAPGSAQHSRRRGGQRQGPQAHRRADSTLRVQWDFLQKICSVSIYLVRGESYREMLNFTYPLPKLTSMFASYKAQLGLYPTSMLLPRIELTSVQLHVIWGTLIQDDWTTTAVGIMLNLVYIPSDKSCVSLARKQVRSDWYRAAWIKSYPKLNEPLMLS